MTPAGGTRGPDSPCDLVTDHTAVLLQSRRIVPLGQWLVAAYRFARETDRRLAVLTPAGTVLTLSAARFLEQLGCLWAGDHGEGTLDGRTGQILDWDGDGFLGTGTYSPLFAPHGDEGWALSVTGETVHAYDDDTRIGRLAAAGFTAAGLRRPIGHGVLEPLDRKFDVDEITRHAKEVSPAPSMLSVASVDGDATVTTIPQPVGLVERFEILAAGDQPLSRAGLEEFAAGMLAAGAQLATLGYRRAVAGRLQPPRLTGPTVPAVFVVASSRVPEADDDTLLAIAGPDGVLLDDPAPALLVCYDPADHRQDQAAGQRGWQRHLRLIEGLDPFDALARAADSRSNTP